MFVVALDMDKDIVYFVPEENVNLAERLVTILDFIKTKRLAFWYSAVISDDDAETEIMVDTMEEFLSIVGRILLEERKAERKEA